jgi:hypothetical protein
MRRIAMSMALGGVLLAGSAIARAQTVAVSGTVDWTALTRFDAHSGEVVFIDLATDTRVVASLTGLEDKVATYSVTLNAGTFYVASAVVADCASDPQGCGTATVGGTHIRFGVTFGVEPQAGSPLVFDFSADPALNPTSICGTVTVAAGTFVKLFATTSKDASDFDFSAGVFSTAIVNAPTTSYCVVGAEFAFVFLDSTITITQNQIPSCPAELDLRRIVFLITGADPITDDIVITVPPPPGQITGTFAVAGFPNDASLLFASNPGPTIGECAGLSFFTTSGGPGSLPFDISPALAGQWTLFANATDIVTTPDGVFQVHRLARATRGSGLFTVDVEAGNPVVPPLSFTPGIVSGSVSLDVRRWGGPFAVLNHFLSLDGATSALGVTGADWSSTAIVVMPMQVTEQYDLNLDPRGTAWAIRATFGSGYQYVFPAPNGSASSGYNGLAAMPNLGGNVPTDIAGSLGILIGSVTAGAHTTVDLPSMDFRIASVTLIPPSGGPSLFWFADKGRYPLSNGVLGVDAAQLSSFSFDANPAVGRAMLPPGFYDGSTIASDPDFNSFTESRTFDLEPDDDLTADFGAPALLAVRPRPGAAGGATTVTGKVVTSDPAVTSLQVLVDGTPASIAADGSFSAGAVIGTSALTIAASDNLGRTTTLKRYFTTISGLFAPAAGADLVSQNQDVNAITNFVFAAPMAKKSFHAPQVIPLRLSGSLAGVSVTSANASAPQVVALVRAAADVPPTTIAPSGQTVFTSTGGQWLCPLSTAGLQPGTYVVQIRFWDGRILEAAFVLS